MGPWRHGYEPTESALIVHGPNSDVDLVNELAQQKRLDAGELGEQAIRAVDRDYLLRPGDLVAVRNAAYTFPAQPGGRDPTGSRTARSRSSNPSTPSATHSRSWSTSRAPSRGSSRSTKPACAQSTPPANAPPPSGSTTRCTASPPKARPSAAPPPSPGHWSQAKQETYVGDTRAIYRHSVHLAREDLGTDGTDEDRISRYAQRISASRQRHASIRSALDPTLQLAARLPDPQPPPKLVDRALARNDTSPEAPTSTPDPSPRAAIQTRPAKPPPTPLTTLAAKRDRLQQRLGWRTRPNICSARLARSPPGRSRASAGNAKPHDSKHWHPTPHPPPTPAHPRPQKSQSTTRRGPNTLPPLSPRSGGPAIRQ